MAAKQAGIHIPTMCWLKEMKPSTSCMVCVVQDIISGKILPACSALVHDGMNIETDNAEVHQMRKSALELLLSEHNGDCEAPCQRVCPAEMDIPRMNRLLSESRFDEAIMVVKQTIALPAVLGYICPAPCENACRRKDIDQSVAICKLKRSAAEEHLLSWKTVTPELKSTNNKKVAVIGAGPAGLASAYYLAIEGFTCHLYDRNKQPGGALRASIPEEVLPKSVLDKEIAIIQSLGVEFFNEKTITTGDISSKSSIYDFIVCTTGGETTIDYTLFERTEFSQIDEIAIYKINNCFVFVPKPLATKTKMAVRAVAVGRKTSEWITEFVENQGVSKKVKPFNSVYKRISEKERIEFLKEAKNHSARNSTIEKSQGFTREQTCIEADRCLHCDCRKKDNCRLCELSTEYKANQRTYTLPTSKNVEKITDHPQIIFEYLKCIKCGICIQTALNEGDKTGFAFDGRGFDIQVKISLDRDIRDAIDKSALHCAKNCPTGAISIKKQ